MTMRILFKLVVSMCFLTKVVRLQYQERLMKMSDVLDSPIYHQHMCQSSTVCAEAQNCMCDETCILYDDCCEGVDTTHFPKTYSSMAKYMSCMRKDWTGNITKGKTVSVISRCPKSFPDEKIKTKCQNIELNSVLGRIPVTSNRTLLTYRNTFCARCHGLRPDEAMIWEVALHCESLISDAAAELPDILTSFMSTESCGIRYRSPETDYDLKERSCTSKDEYPYVDECPEGYDPYVKILCRSYYLPLFIFYHGELFRFYRNKHCLQCDHSPVSASIFNLFDIRCNGPLTQVDRFNPMVIMLNFSALLYDSSDSMTSCRENEVYIGQLDLCVFLHCPEKSFARNSICVPYGKKMNTYAMTALFYINGSVDETIVKERLKNSTGDIAYKCGGYVSLFNEKVNHISLLTGSDSRSNQSCMIATIQQEFRRQGLRYSAHDSRCFQINLQQQHVQRLTDDVIMTYIDDVASTSCIVNENVRRSSFMLTAFLKSTNETAKCPLIEVYVLQPEKKTNSSENHNSTDEIYGIGDIMVDARNVTITPNGYFICWSVFKRYYDTSVASKDTNIYTVITHVCLGFSVASLLVTVFHYCVVSKLLNNHSIILLHLVVVTLLSHSVYMVSLYLHSGTYACWVVAIILHCLFLTLFTSSSLALLQITKQLRSMKNPLVKTDIRTMLLRYVLTGYIVSLTVVGVTALVKNLMFSYEVWYGRNVCFISNPYVLLYSFALPVAVSLLFNVCVFSFTIRSFYLDKPPSSATATVNRSFFMLSLKLSTLLGVSWLVGYIAVVTNNIVLVVIYEVTTALHGVMLSAGLLSNQAVINWYRAKCSCLFETTQSRNGQSGTPSNNPQSISTPTYN